VAAAQEIFADIERRFAEQIGERRLAEFRETLARLRQPHQAARAA
jgi:hypothetical protein